MRLKLITKDNLQDFEDHLPAAYAESPELLGVACIEEAEDEDVIMGSAVVSPNEAEDTLEIQWIYVQPEHRRKGAGSLLLQGIRDMAKAAGLRLVDVCFPGGDTEEEESDDWTFDPAEEPDDRWDASDDSGEDENTEIGILQQFLQAKDFLTMSEYPIYSFLVSDVIHSEFVKTHEKNRKNRIMADYEGIPWRDLPETMRGMVREKVTQTGFFDFTYLCSPDISFVCVKGGKLLGCLLARDDPEEKTITVQLFIDFVEDPVCSAKLITVAGDRIISSYPEDYRVSFIALNESSRKLLGTILDDEKKLRQDGCTVRGILEA